MSELIQTEKMPKSNRSPVYAIADELEAMTYRKGDLAPRMDEARRRFGTYPSVYLEDPSQWPEPGVVGVWIEGRDVVVRWIDPDTGVKTSALRLTAE